jgi:hypothetical protein
MPLLSSSGTITVACYHPVLPPTTRAWDPALRRAALRTTDGSSWQRRSRAAMQNASCPAARARPRHGSKRLEDRERGTLVARKVTALFSRIVVLLAAGRSPRPAASFPALRCCRSRRCRWQGMCLSLIVLPHRIDPETAQAGAARWSGDAPKTRTDQGGIGRGKTKRAPARPHPTSLAPFVRDLRPRKRSVSASRQRAPAYSGPVIDRSIATPRCGSLATDSRSPRSERPSVAARARLRGCRRRSARVSFRRLSSPAGADGDRRPFDRRASQDR